MKSALSGLPNTKLCPDGSETRNFFLLTDLEHLMSPFHRFLDSIGRLRPSMPSCLHDEANGAGKKRLKRNIEELMKQGEWELKNSAIILSLLVIFPSTPSYSWLKNTTHAYRDSSSVYWIICWHVYPTILIYALHRGPLSFLREKSS